MYQFNEIKYAFEKIKVTTKRLMINKLGLTVSKNNGINQYSGTSFPFGKEETIEFIIRECPNKNSKILDVGPGQGIYNKLLKEKGYKNIDAVEIYFPYIEQFKLNELYNNVFHQNIIGFEYDYYDVVIMGDVIEHLKVKDAQIVIEYAQKNNGLVIVAVPYLLSQIGSQLDGSGDHRQPDLTREVFLSRFSGFTLLTDNNQLGVFYSINQ